MLAEGPPNRSLSAGFLPRRGGGKLDFMPGTPTMPSDDAALERSSHPRRLLDRAVSGLGALFAAALFLGLFDFLGLLVDFLGLLDHGPSPKPAQAEAEAAPAPGLCFHGPASEFLGFAPAGQRCP